MAEPVREMATETATDAVNSTPQPKKAVTVTVQLKPVNNSDQPLSVNYTGCSVAPGVVYLDFGFVEPALLAALSRNVKAGLPVPPTVEGKLAVRVGLGYDALHNLYRQLDGVLRGLSSGIQGKKGMVTPST